MNTIQVLCFSVTFKAAIAKHCKALQRKMKENNQARNNDIWSWKICVFESFMETQGSSSANQNLDVIVPETQQGPVVFHERVRKTLEWIFGNQRVGSPPLPGPEPGNQGPEHTRLPGTQAAFARSILRRTYVCEYLGRVNSLFFSHLTQNLWQAGWISAAPEVARDTSWHHFARSIQHYLLLCANL